MRDTAPEAARIEPAARRPAGFSQSRRRKLRGSHEGVIAIRVALGRGHRGRIGGSAANRKCLGGPGAVQL